MEDCSTYLSKNENSTLPPAFISSGIGTGKEEFRQDFFYPSPPFTSSYVEEAPSIDLINTSLDLIFENFEFVPSLITFTQSSESGLKCKMIDDVSELYVDEDFENAMKLLELLQDYFKDDELMQEEEQSKRMEHEEHHNEKMMVEKKEEFDQIQNENEEGEVSHDGIKVVAEKEFEVSEPQLRVKNSLVIQPSLIREDKFPSPSEAAYENKDIPFTCVSAATQIPLSTVESCPTPSTPIAQTHTPTSALKSSSSSTQSWKQRFVGFFKGSVSRKPRSLPIHPKHQDSVYVSHMQIPGATNSLCPNHLHLTTQNSMKFIKQVETPGVRESAQKKTARCFPKLKWTFRNPNKNTGSPNESLSKDQKNKKKNTFTKIKMLEKFKLKFQSVSGLFSLKHFSKYFSKCSFSFSSTSPSTSTSAVLNPYTSLLHYHEPQAVSLPFLDIQLPLFLFVLWRYIDRDEILSTSGIFRMSSNVGNVFAFLEEYKFLSLDKIQNEPLNPNYIFEPTDILKKWLRENPSSIFPPHHNPTLQELSKSTACEDTFLSLKNIIFSLDSSSREVLKFILYLSHRVLTFSSLNSMNELSLARTIGPNVFSYTDVTSVNAFDWGIHIFNMLLQKELDFWFTSLTSNDGPFVS